LKVLLTGASGFVGSHILDSLRERDFETAILLRSTSPTRFIEQHRSKTEVRLGSISDPDSLRQATKDITHVIHCAGCTRVLNISEFYQVNHQGTLNLVEAVNVQSPAIQRFLHISSLAVSGPAIPENPAREDQPLRPVSEYGKSKLAAETAVRERCRVPFTILRPPVVYGPRDTACLSIFKAVKNHLLPRLSKDQALSLVYVKDLAQAVVSCLVSPVTAGQTYFVASPEIVTGRSMAEEVAVQLARWTIPFPINTTALWAMCLLQEALSKLTRRATLLNLQKYAELSAPGWVCSPAKLLRETGVSCDTALKQGVAQTLQWYTREHWL
jgi:nucleoside-diphosphate-sugar epimerase